MTCTKKLSESIANSITNYQASIIKAMNSNMRSLFFRQTKDHSKYLRFATSFPQFDFFFPNTA